MAVAVAKEILTLRVPRHLSDEVRSVAERDGETQSCVLRRLLRIGLEQERQQGFTAEGRS